jgi:hypothetical protein
MKVRQLGSVFLVVAAAACSDYAAPTGIPTEPDPVLLKDVELSSLPSPFYHFEYDATGRASRVAFASGLTTYDLIYEGSQLTRVRREAATPARELKYVYDDQGRVSTVVYINSTGNYAVVFLTYDGGRLVELERDVRVDGGFIIDKTSTFTYDATGNLTELRIHRPAIDGSQTETTTVDHFEDYDTGANVEDFSLLHDEFFDELILLPGVKFQVNNPRRETRTGDGINYVIDWSYTYDAKQRLAAKTGNLLLTNGAQSGSVFQLTGAFSYY